MFYQTLLEDLRKAKSKIENNVLRGQAHDFASYRFLTGQIKGLEDAINICQTIFNINKEKQK